MNLDVNEVDRGNSMKQYSSGDRLGPCRAPFDTFVIDYDGSVIPCRNIRSDYPPHQAMIVGNLLSPGASIFNIYAGRLSAWRRSMVGFGAKAFPCTTCRHLDDPENSLQSIASRLKDRLVQIDRTELSGLPIASDKSGHTFAGSIDDLA